MNGRAETDVDGTRPAAEGQRVTRTRAQRPSKRGEYYCRLYWRFIDEYPEIFDDPAALGTYMQLLYQAETHWPQRASVPRSVDEGSLERPEQVGLVIFERGDRYTIKGLVASAGAHG